MSTPLRETGPGGSRPDAPVKYIALRGAFHGRTDRPAQVSDSSLPKYKAKPALPSRSART